MSRVTIYVVSHTASDTLVDAYVVSCDVDAHGGRGSAVFTKDLNKAMKFSCIASAVAYYQRQSTVKPLRDDGSPNRPLTAFTVEIAREATIKGSAVR